MGEVARRRQREEHKLASEEMRGARVWRWGMGTGLLGREPLEGSQWGYGVRPP